MKINNKYIQSIFIDTSDVSVIHKWNLTGVIDGVTTNPQIMLNDGVTKNNYFKIIGDICDEMGDKSVSVELISDRNNKSQLIDEAFKLREISKNITIKIPFNPLDTNSLELMNYLAVEKSISVNATVMMNFEQLFLAANSMKNAPVECFVSLFWGRSSEDWSQRSGENYSPSGLKMGNVSSVDFDPRLISVKIMEVLSNFKNVNLIVGSLRNAAMVGDAIATGANVVTVPPDILNSMLYSKRSVETLEQFDKAWNTLISAGI